MHNTVLPKRKILPVTMGERSSTAALSLLAMLVLLPIIISGCQKSGGPSLQSIASARGLSPADMESAIRTFVPPGKKDDYYIFASGGHSGQVHVIGVPSMRLLKTIPVFSQDSWSGYGLGTTESESLFKEGSAGEDVELRWGDSHHPALSETDGDYDGKWLYINDRANGRVAMIDLRDFATKQILKIPNIETCHGGVFVTPNSEYAYVSAMVPKAYAFSETQKGVTLDDHLNHYKDIYRGVASFLKIKKDDGHLDLAQSFQIELPPYGQDISDAGKGVSDGFVFTNSYNTEMATGGTKQGRPTIEVGASANDFDYLHVIDWKKAEQLVAAGKAEVHNGVRVLPLQTAIDNGVLYFVPEPRSPHGVDVSPDGNYLVVAGKLDPHVTIFSMELIKKAIATKNFEKHDAWGVPVLNYKACVAGQVEVGAGPLHTQFDGNGNAYTSLFLENAVAKWTLGTPYHPADKAWKLVDKITIHYNIGHLTMPCGDTRHPEGKYIIAMDKWSIDRYGPVGPLLPQNFQLIDISWDKMKLLSDMPIGFAEPHYAQTIPVSRLHPIQTYALGTDPLTMKLSPNALKNAKDARIERHGNVVDVYMSVIRSSFSPDIVEVHKGDLVRFHITNIEQTLDATHGFAVPEYNISASLEPGATVDVEFNAIRPGSFSYYCTEFCSALHLEMQGWLLVN
ncbi:MAG: Sec-dependent nitrous-oxide reductase [Bacteroidota bacterium]|nr:Sec-dependent nitrous-oxide reductase [Bacteroidota bacterium]